LVAGAAALALVAAGFTNVPPASAQAGAIYLVDGVGVSDAVTAVSTDVGLYVKYVGAAQTGTATVAVDASTGDIAFVVNGAADATVICPSGGTPGTIDVSDAACDTFVEVINVINKTANWRAAPGAVIGTDTTINTLITRSAATASGPDGVALLKDTVVALNVTADLTPNYYSGGRSMKFFLSPTGGGSLTQNLIPNPYNNFATWVAYATETITSSGTIGAFAILGVTQNHLNKQGTTAYSYQETVRTIVSQVGAATTVEKNYDFTRFPLRANPGERILVRIAAGTDLTVPKVGGYGVMQNNRQN
jgi:hypothetical protein